MVLYNTIIETIYDEKNILKTNQKREPAMGRTFNEKSKLAIKRVVNPVGKRSLGKLKMWCEDMVKENMEAFGGGPNWKILTVRRYGPNDRINPT